MNKTDKPGALGSAGLCVWKNKAAAGKAYFPHAFIFALCTGRVWSEYRNAAFNSIVCFFGGENRFFDILALAASNGADAGC